MSLQEPTGAYRSPTRVYRSSTGAQQKLTGALQERTEALQKPYRKYFLIPLPPLNFLIRFTHYLLTCLLN